jgi:Raf kinase inhibitor-like YbhB/YbcL family protein
MKLNKISSGAMRRGLQGHLKVAANYTLYITGVVAIIAACSAVMAIGQSGPPPGGQPSQPGQTGQAPDWRTILAGPPPILTIDRPQTKTDGELKVTSASFGPNGEIPTKCTSYGQSISPEVSWTKGPQGTASYVLIMEDASAGMDRKGVLHWMAFNIPSEVTSLPEGLPQTPTGMIVANNREGKAIYVGPHAPAGAPPFHYQVEIFALDKNLDLAAAATREDLWDAMNGHVLAKGGVTGTFQGPVK